MMRKSAKSVAMVNRWIEINEPKKELITDHRSTIPNLNGYKEHRHDQSSFSVLVKQMPHIEISWHETQPKQGGDWESLNDYPIQARRHKEQNRPLAVVLWNKALHPWRRFLHFYFCRIRHYEFAGPRYVW